MAGKLEGTGNDIGEAQNGAESRGCVRLDLYIGDYVLLQLAI